MIQTTNQSQKRYTSMLLCLEWTWTRMQTCSGLQERVWRWGGRNIRRHREEHILLINSTIPLLSAQRSRLIFALFFYGGGLGLLMATVGALTCKRLPPSFEQQLAFLFYIVSRFLNKTCPCFFFFPFEHFYLRQLLPQPLLRPWH